MKATTTIIDKEIHHNIATKNPRISAISGTIIPPENILVLIFHTYKSSPMEPVRVMNFINATYHVDNANNAPPIIHIMYIIYSIVI